MKSITILWGLPASGKSTYANQFIPKHWSDRQKIHVVRADAFRKPRSLIDLIVGECDAAPTVIVDSLVTTNEQADNLMSAIQKKHDCTFKIVYWNENRDACLWNDRGRREVKSEISIKNMPLEKPSNELIKKFNATLTVMEVERKPNWMVWANENGIYEKNLKSMRWSLGGNAGNCWNDNMYTISADPQPASFTEFDQLLEKICPQIGFMTYKRISAECTKIETHGESDYYGGSVQYAHFECDMELLYQKLVDENLIQPI